jgi:hypothetical protein
MNKLKLDLDQLTVESFNTDASGIARRGTVRAHSEFFCLPTHLCAPTYGEFTCGDTCDNTCHTCGASCGGGCGSGYSCYGSCAETCNTCLTNCQQESCVASCP